MSLLLKGTPKDLKTAIENGTAGADNGGLQGHIRDYLSQKFSVAMMRAESATTPDEAQAIVRDLWNAITGEHKEASK